MLVRLASRAVWDNAILHVETIAVNIYKCAISILPISLNKTTSISSTVVKKPITPPTHIILGNLVSPTFGLETSYSN